MSLCRDEMMLLGQRPLCPSDMGLRAVVSPVTLRAGGSGLAARHTYPPRRPYVTLTVTVAVAWSLVQLTLTLAETRYRPAVL
jgi:hypothetical protein